MSRKPFATGSSFGELGAMFGHEPAEKPVHHKPVEFKPATASPTQELVEQNLKGKFDQLIAGNFKLDLPGVESVSITPLQTKPGEKKTVYATVFFRSPNGKELNTTFSIFEDGVISGKMPKEINTDRNELEKAIVETISRVNVEFWHQTDTEILPFQDEGSAIDTSEQDQDGGRSVNDPARLEFLQRQQQSLFGFVGKTGFDGYHGALFPTFIVLENPKTKNAAFIVDLSEKIQLDSNRARQLGKEEKDALIQQVWSPIAARAKTRRQLKELGAKKIVHTLGTWQERMQREIDQRLAS